MKIVTYNVNGIRAANRLGILNWMQDFDADIYCLQEVRAEIDMARAILDNIGYNVIYNPAEKKGYSGTAILSKLIPDKFICGLNFRDLDTNSGQINTKDNIIQMIINDDGVDNTSTHISNKSMYDDPEGRTITAIYGNLAVVNCYVPNGGMRLEFKMDFFEKLTRYLCELKKKYDVILCSDTNIAHDELDVSHPKLFSKRTGYLPIEREAITDMFNSGFVDSFRKLNPNKREYSWRSYRSREIGGDFGWKYRFDYIIVNTEHISAVTDVRILDLPYSDHLPVVANINSQL